MPMVTVRYWAAAKHAAGVAEETLDAATLAEALAAAVARRPAAERVPRRAGPVLVPGGRGAGGRARRPRPSPLAEGAVIEVLPPFAGG